MAAAGRHDSENIDDLLYKNFYFYKVDIPSCGVLENCTVQVSTNQNDNDHFYFSQKFQSIRLQTVWEKQRQRMLLTGSTVPHPDDQSQAMEIYNQANHPGPFFPVQSYDVYLPEEQLQDDFDRFKNQNITYGRTANINMYPINNESSSEEPEEESLKHESTNSEQDLSEFRKVRVLLPYSDESTNFLFANGVLPDDPYASTAQEFLEKGNDSAQIIEFLFVKYIGFVNKKVESSQTSMQPGIANLSPEYVTIFFYTKKIVIHGPIITSEVSFGHSIGIFEKAAQAILDFAGHLHLQST